MVSIFSTRIMAPVIMLIGASIILATVTTQVKTSTDIMLLLIACVMGIPAWYWALFGEIRLRVIKVELGADHLVVRKYFGLGRERVFYYHELDGYDTRVLPSEHDNYEYLFIKKDGKRVARLSEFYHENYVEMKAEIGRRLKGTHVPFSWWEEIRDVFS